MAAVLHFQLWSGCRRSSLLFTGVLQGKNYFSSIFRDGHMYEFHLNSELSLSPKRPSRHGSSLRKYLFIATGENSWSACWQWFGFQMSVLYHLFSNLRCHLQSPAWFITSFIMNLFFPVIFPLLLIKHCCPPFLSIWEFESCYLSSLVTIFPGTESVRGLFHLILGEVVCRFTLTIRHNITFISSIARELMCLNILINVEGTLIWIIIISAWIHQQMEKMHLLACFDV